MFDDQQHHGDNNHKNEQTAHADSSKVNDTIDSDNSADIDNAEINQTDSSSAPEDLRTEIASLKDQLLRALAEVENIRRRSDRERMEASQYAITKFARDMLNVSDNLVRALDNIPEIVSQNENMAKFIEGVRLTKRELHNTFERYSIKKVMPQGEAFDHNFHQAIMETPTAEHAPGTVVQVLQSGYILQDRLLRPAMVSVAKSID